MKVFLGYYDIQKGGQGAEVFLNAPAAINAVIGWCNHYGLLSDEASDTEITEEQAREALQTTGSLAFDGRACYFSINEQDVKGQTGKPGEKATPMPIEALVAVSTAHLSANGVAWMNAGGDGSIFYPNAWGGFLYVAGPEANTMCADAAAIPAEVHAIAKWAREQGLVWVKFDADGTEFGALDTFEH